jgi:hypothetical protein
LFDYESGTLVLRATPRWYRREHLREGRVGAALEIFRKHLGEDLRSLLLNDDDIVIEVSMRKGAPVSELTEKLQGIVRDHVEPLDGQAVCWTTQPEIGVLPIAESKPASGAVITCGVRECGGKAVARTSSGVPICADCRTACGLSSGAVELAVSLNAAVPLRSTAHVEALRARLATLINSNGVLSPLARIFDDYLSGGAS